MAREPSSEQDKAKPPSWMPRLFIAIYRSVIAQDFSALSDWFWDECKAMKRGWELFIFSGLVIFILTSCWDSRIEDGLKNEIANLKEDNRNLKQEIAALNTQLIPFRTIALEKYTGPESERLRKLGQSLADMQKELDETKAKAAPIALIFDSMNTKTNPDSTITATLVFRYSKNQVPGSIQLAARTPDGSTNTIIGFVPNASCGAFASGAGMHQVHANGNIHTTSYSPMGGVATCVDLTTSRETPVEITGNCDLKPFVVVVRIQR